MVRADKRERKTETERHRLRLACARHLKDLKRAHSAPPPDVRIKPSATPARISAMPALCAELIS